MSFAPHMQAEFTFLALPIRCGPFRPGCHLERRRGGRAPGAKHGQATAWKGIMMGLRRDRRILILFTCPASTPELPIHRIALRSLSS